VSHDVYFVMNPLTDRPRAESALRVLDSLGAPTSDLWKWLAYEVERAESGSPSPSDLSWPLIQPDGILDHLERTVRAGNGESTRPVLSCAITVGRAYELSPAQRDVLRSRFGFTPTKTVEVVEIETFKGHPGVVRKVVLKSGEHIDPRRRAILQQVTITAWGEFMSQCTARATEREQEAEYQKRLTQVTDLLYRADFEKQPNGLWKARPDDKKIKHKERGPGAVATILAAQVELKKLTDPREIREELRAILISRGEDTLAALVKEPSIPRKEEELPDEFYKQLGL
jgi:hypothetical protein